MKPRLQCLLLLFLVGGALQASAEEKPAAKADQIEQPQAATGKVQPGKPPAEVLFDVQDQSSCPISDSSGALGRTVPGVVFLNAGPLPCAQYDCGCHEQVGCSVNSDCGTCTGTPCFCSSYILPKRCLCP